MKYVISALLIAPWDAQIKPQAPTSKALIYLKGNRRINECATISNKSWNFSLAVKHLQNPIGSRLGG